MKIIVYILFTVRYSDCVETMNHKQRQDEMKNEFKQINNHDYCRQLLYVYNIETGSSVEESIEIVNNTEFYFYDKNIFSGVTDGVIAFLYRAENGKIVDCTEISIEFLNNQ